MRPAAKRSRSGRFGHPARTGARWFVLGQTIALAALLAGCSLFRQLSFERPSLRLSAIQVTEIDLSGVSVVLWLDVFNPNDYDIRTTRVEADLNLEDVHFGNATWEESIVLGAASTTTVKLPADFSWEGIGAGARALLQRGKVSYDLDARLHVVTSFGSRTVSLGQRGVVDILN